MPLQELFTQQFEAYEQQLNGQRSGDVHQQRQAAMEVLKRTGLPGKKDEEYKYTPITRALEKQFTTLDVTSSENHRIRELLDQWLIPEEANVLVFINGQFSDEYSAIISPPSEVKIQSLAEATESQPDLMSQYFARQTASSADSCVALNTALAHEGTVVSVPSGQVASHPVHCYFISDAQQHSVFNQVRNLFVVGEGSQVNFSELFCQVGEHASYHNATTELWLHKNAIAYHHKIQNEGKTAYHTGSTYVYQSANSVFQSVTITLDGAMVRNNLHVSLDAENCETHMYGLYMLDGKTHVDNHTNVDHLKPNSFSNELYKGIMDDASHGVFNGKIYVRANAQKTNAFQSNRNILLTDKASIDTKPQLEIWADDVKCSHGATTGQIDTEQLFYLRARGLDKVQARALLLQAFAGEVVQYIKSDALQEKMRELIAHRLLEE